MQKSTTQARRELAALQSEYNTLMNRKNVLSTLIDKIIIGERENRHAKRMSSRRFGFCSKDSVSWTILYASNGNIPTKSDRRYGFLHISYRPGRLYRDNIPIRSRRSNVFAYLINLTAVPYAITSAAPCITAEKAREMIPNSHFQMPSISDIKKPNVLSYQYHEIISIF